MPKIYSKGIKVKDGNGVWHDLPTVVSEEAMRAAEDARASSAAAEQSAAAAEAAAEYASQWPAYEAMEAAQEAAASADQAASSAADAVRALAVVEGQFPEGIATTVTEWLEENVDPVGSAVTVDASLLIEGSAADAKETGDNIRYNTHKVFRYDEEDPASAVAGVTWAWSNHVLAYSGTSTAASELMLYEDTTALPDGIEAGQEYYAEYESTDEDVLMIIYYYVSGSASPKNIKFTHSGFFTVPDNAIGMKIGVRMPYSGLTVNGSVRKIDILKKERHDEQPEKIHGVYEIKPEWRRGTSDYTYGYFTPVSTANLNKYLVTDLIPIQKSGVYIYNDSLQFMRAHFWKYSENHEVVAATNYPYYRTEGANVTGGFARYYPYQEGVYITVVLYGYPVALSPTASSDVHIMAGEITENGGKLPNLSCCSVIGNYASGVVENQFLMFYPFYGTRTIESEQTVNFTDKRAHSYVSVLRLQDVNRIVIAPPYSGVARVYRISDDDRAITIEDEIFAPVCKALSDTQVYKDVNGKSVLDFTGYNFRGFIVFGIITEPVVTYTQTESGWTSWFELKSNGFLRQYKDAMNHVFVEYKVGVNVERDAGIPAQVKYNIDAICDNTFAPDMMASPPWGGYGNSIAGGTKGAFGEKGHVNGWWYNGSNRFNVPHMHVTPKSYITASKNLHSRVYDAEARGTDRSKYENMYGSGCSSTVGLILGQPCGIDTHAVTSQLHEDLTYRPYTCLDDIRAGDLVASEGNNMAPEAGGSFGHVNYCVETVSVNGERICVNMFDGAMPWTSFRTYFNLEALDGYTVEKQSVEPENILVYYSQRYFEDKAIAMLARIPGKKCRTFRNEYGPYDTQDYEVTEIMCDRGTDSVYALSEPKTLYITDGTTSVDVYLDGTFKETVDLTPYLVSGYTDYYDITDLTDEPGYYEIYVSGVKKESFFVPPDRYLFATRDADLTMDAKCRIDFDPNEEDDEVVCVEIMYYLSPSGDYIFVPYYGFNADTTVESGHAHFDAPKYIMSYNDHKYYASRIDVLRRTPYGTYCTYYTITPEEYWQRAGHPFAE